MPKKTVKKSEKLMERYSKRVAKLMLKGQGELDKAFKTAELRVTKASSGWGWALYFKGTLATCSASSKYRSKRAAEDAFCETNMLTMAAMATYDSPSASDLTSTADRLERTARKVEKKRRDNASGPGN